jgi:hypothetical protein
VVIITIQVVEETRGSRSESRSQFLARLDSLFLVKLKEFLQFALIEILYVFDISFFIAKRILYLIPLVGSQRVC